MYLKSLSLFIQSVCTDENLRNPTYISKIEKLIDKIGGYAIPHRIRFALFEYFEAVGRFGKAEDMLYELIDEKYPDIIAEGESFYLNLLQKTDRELSDGNLPRDEVVEGLEYLQKFGAADGNDNPADG
jgi:hypothetical protein